MSLLPVEAALERILRLCTRLDAEVTPVAAALGRALVRDVRASRTLPPWDNSAMDGYAVHTHDTERPGATLKVSSIIHAGERPVTRVEPGCCARIMTGAQVPAGADAVVMQEKTRPAAEGFVIIDEVPKAGQNIRRRGEDIEEGALLLPAGRALGVAEQAALWAQGLSEVEVGRRPRVAIASSGDELCDVTEPPNGRIVDTNTPVLAQLVSLNGGTPTVLGRASDRLDALRDLFRRGLEHDVLITVAGASVGEKDFTREALESLGVAVDFWKVAMKPGKPLAVGRRDRTLVFGLPGNPVSAMVTFELFVRPALRVLQGLPLTLPVLPARLAEPIKKAAGLRHFLRARLERRGTEVWAVPLSSQSSGALASAVGATHLISIGSDETQIPSGAVVEVLPLSWGA